MSCRFYWLSGLGVSPLTTIQKGTIKMVVFRRKTFPVSLYYYLSPTPPNLKRNSPREGSSIAITPPHDSDNMVIYSHTFESHCT